MRDPQRIRRILELLSSVWSKVPEWRLTHLVINASDTQHNCGPVFYLEDEEFERRLEKLSAAIDSRTVGDQSDAIRIGSTANTRRWTQRNRRHEADIQPSGYNLRMLRKVLRFAMLYIVISLMCGVFLLLEWLPFRPHSTLGWVLFFVGAIPATIVGERIGELIFGGQQRKT